MKIAILTFHNAHNYGAVLQAYALRTYLRSKGAEVKILNYHNSVIQSGYQGLIPYKYGIKDFLHLRRLPKALKQNISTFFAQSYFRKRCDSFNRFISEVCLENEDRILGVKDIADYKCDAFVVGSDQVWNSDLTGGLDPVYFLAFPTNAKKFFYGCSTGEQVIREQELPFFRKYLAEALAVSTREAELAIDISKKCGIQASCVVDPTLLLSVEDYNRLIAEKGHIKPKDRYVLAYFIYEDKKTQTIAEYIARTLGIELIEFRCFYRRDLRSHSQMVDKGPADFLRFVREAEFVVTNSFHGTVFSLIFQKQFYSVYDVDSRKEGLLKIAGVEHRHIKSPKDVNLRDTIDYSVVESGINEARKKSENYLEGILSG